MKGKSSNNIRISFQNVNGFFTEDNMEYKPNQIRQFMQEKQYYMDGKKCTTTRDRHNQGYGRKTGNY